MLLIVSLCQCLLCHCVAFCRATVSLQVVVFFFDHEGMKKHSRNSMWSKVCRRRIQQRGFLGPPSAVQQQCTTVLPYCMALHVYCKWHCSTDLLSRVGKKNSVSLPPPDVVQNVSLKGGMAESNDEGLPSIEESGRSGSDLGPLSGSDLGPLSGSDIPLGDPDLPVEKPGSKVHIQ